MSDICDHDKDTYCVWCIAKPVNVKNSAGFTITTSSETYTDIKQALKKGQS